MEIFKPISALSSISLPADNVRKPELFCFMCYRRNRRSQLTFTCSKSTIETLEKIVKYVQI